MINRVARLCKSNNVLFNINKSSIIVQTSSSIPTINKLFYTTTATNTPTTNTTTSTLRNEEINFFNKLSADWWNPEGTMKPLHRMNPFRVKYICDRLKQSNSGNSSGIVSNNPIHSPLSGLTAMDIGCGAGLLSESLSRLGASKVIGLDAAKNNIMMAISHAQTDIKLNENIENKSLEYIESTIENFISDNQSKQQQFDLICSLEVLEHVDNPKQFIDLCTSLLKPGGSIFISTINKTFISYVSAILGAEYIFRMVPVGTHHWDQFISPEDLKSQLSAKNCNTVDTQGLVYNPLKCEWDFTDDLSVNYIVHAIKK